jgi:hypothetical protein
MKNGPKPTIKVGDKFTTNNGGTAEVIQYNDAYDIVVRFDNGYERRVRASNLRAGKVKNPVHASIFGVGYIGVGRHKTESDGKVSKVYSDWHHMLGRCYDEGFLAEYPTYRGCSVCEEWHNFQSFAAWYDEQPNAGKKGFALDKDLMVLGNKVYSPEFCSLVPHQINTLLIDCGARRGHWPVGVCYDKRSKKYVSSISKNGTLTCLGRYPTHEEAASVYKIEKENYVREQAERYKSVLHPKIYNNLLNYRVTDIEAQNNP